MMKQYMKNKSRLGFFLAMCLGLFSCSKFLEENPKDIDNATKDAFLYYRDLHMKRQS